jgi:RNA polymerase sigma factor (sigma-70 family)
MAIHAAHVATTHPSRATAARLRGPFPAGRTIAMRPSDPFMDLCAAALEGDEGAFAELYRRLGGGIRNMFQQRTGKSDLAEDLAQKTWTAFWQAMKQGKYNPERAAVSTFLYAVSSKIWLQHLRTARRAERRQAQAQPAIQIGSGGPVETLHMAELLQATRACLAGAGDLTDDERWLVRAVAGGESDRALAKRLGVSASTANARKRAAFDKVRRYLATQGHRGEMDSSERRAAAGKQPL